MLKYNMENFEKYVKEFGITLNERQLEQFILYYELLVEWNKVMNLTTITEFDEVIQKHFVDSLSLVKAIDLSQQIAIIDVGTGAGFPGIPLKIVFPNLKITLLDSVNKKVKFLNEVISTLQLESIKVIHGRAEDYAKPGQLREQFDLCVSRAVAKLATLSEYCLPFVKVDGTFISYKSEKIVEEAVAAKGGIFLLGGKYQNQVEFHLPDSDIYRNLFVITKVRSTPKKYPRQAGLPAKQPLIN